LHPVVTAQFRLAARFLDFCSPGPLLKYNAPSIQTATTGVTCGRPSARTVDTQNSPARSRRATASGQGAAWAFSSL
jgi:hypothetical protein